MTTTPQSMGISLVEKIRADILTARLAPGTKVTVRMLGDLFGCGATPVREALNQLASEALVTRIDRRGFFVAAISRAEFEDVLFNRCLLEGAALRRSIERGGPAWEDGVPIAHYRLGTLSRDIDRAGVPVPNPDREAAHKRFHMALLAACGSGILLATCERLSGLNDRYRFFARQSRGPARPVDQEHTQLRDLALSRQPDAAVQALLDHYRRTGDAIVGQGDDAPPPAHHPASDTRNHHAGNGGQIG